MIDQKNGQPPPTEPHRGCSSVVMPDGSWVCVAHNAPYDLQIAMTLQWAEEWAKEQA